MNTPADTHGVIVRVVTREVTSRSGKARYVARVLRLGALAFASRPRRTPKLAEEEAERWLRDHRVPRRFWPLAWCGPSLS